jgi:hypothetical protein
MSYAKLFPFCVWPRHKTLKKEYFPKERLGNQQYKFIPMIGNQNYSYNPATLYLTKYAEMTSSTRLYLSNSKINYKHSR